MEVPRVRRRPVSTYQTLLAGWTSLGRSAPEGGKEDRKLRQRQAEQLAALRSSPQFVNQIGNSFWLCKRPEFYTRSAATARPSPDAIAVPSWSRGYSVFYRSCACCFRIFVDIR